MMAENPNWWSMVNGMHPHDESNDHQNISSHEQKFVYASADSPLSNSNTTAADHHHHPTTTQDFPVIRSWSQLLLGGLAGGEEEEGGGGGGERLFNNSVFQQQKKLENNWEEQVLFNLQNQSNYNNRPVFDVKQEQLVSQSTNSRSGGGQLYDNEDDCDQILLSNSWPNHHHHEAPLASNFSNNNNNFFNCSGGKAAEEGRNNVYQHNQDYSSECNSTSSNGGVSKKARVHQSSAQPALKVRKEKLGDRITALHQLVSPFGKTDTASVLSEAIGYIRFLQSQIQALSFPYMRNASPVHNTAHHHHHQHSVQERNCLINPEEAADLQDSQTSRGARDLRSRGLCLVPISCTENVGNDNGADYWAPSTIGGGF